VDDVNEYSIYHENNQQLLFVDPDVHRGLEQMYVHSMDDQTILNDIFVLDLYEMLQTKEFLRSYELLMDNLWVEYLQI
jgi:hypothetical protein